VNTAHNRDIVIVYETFGSPDGAPLLLISGTGAQMLIWPEDFCAALAGRGFQVARFDNRDAGRPRTSPARRRPGGSRRCSARPPRPTDWTTWPKTHSP